MGHPADLDEILEIISDELRAVVGDYPRRSIGETFSGGLKDQFDFRLGNRFPNIP